MLNLSKQPSDARAMFIDAFAAALAPWGLPQNTARLYAYLLLSDTPQGLDQIATNLEISKSLACTAAKVLEQQDMARRYRQRGSKRVFYAVSEHPGGHLVRQAALLGDIVKLMRSPGLAANEGAAGERLRRFAGFYSHVREAMDDALQSADAPVDTETLSAD